MRLKPEAFWAHYVVGACNFRLARYSDAVAALTASTQRNSDFVFTYLIRGVAHGELRDWPAAEADFPSTRTTMGRPSAISLLFAS